VEGGLGKKGDLQSENVDRRQSFTGAPFCPARKSSVQLFRLHDFGGDNKINSPSRL